MDVLGARACMAVVTRTTALCSDAMQRYTGLVKGTSPVRCTSTSARAFPEAICHQWVDIACHDGNAP